ncbi:MAG: hypothetical protein J0J01_01385 [Reyranella sp.]|uniref:hypothetical protein n=1 Tax=Reyranella sp. TaxID=1929291 RepID=UPI001AC8834C|nr:hypothetical protein [Reyranella sp.]MBN9085533.1 hypothetical protein [Reyranella sp.]
MASVRVVAALLLSGVSLGACNLPVPDYKTIPYPAPYRKEADGAVLDNEDMRLDAQGYRLDKQGRRIGEVDVQTKTSGESSNAMAGYYISSRGANAPGNVMVPSEGANTGAGYGPGSATITPGVEPTAPMMPPASGQPVPLAPSR